MRYDITDASEQIRTGCDQALPTSYLVLGMVRLGVSSGYAIKKIADQSTQNFWPTSLALIYPELARLEEGGLLNRRSDPQGRRARSAYTITERGEVARTAWLRAEKVAAVQIRDEAMLKLFMADALAEPSDHSSWSTPAPAQRGEKGFAARGDRPPGRGIRIPGDPLHRCRRPPLRRSARRCRVRSLASRRSSKANWRPRAPIPPGTGRD